VAGIYNNLGNLDLASNNVDDAIVWYNRSARIWKQGGDSTAANLALTYLCMARYLMLRGELDEALSMTTKSEALFSRTQGNEAGFITYVYYLTGNIHYLAQHWSLSWRSYNECLKIGLATMPIHPLTAAAYYSLGCVEISMGHAENAKNYLDKAR